MKKIVLASLTSVVALACYTSSFADSASQGPAIIAKNLINQAVKKCQNAAADYQAFIEGNSHSNLKYPVSVTSYGTSGIVRRVVGQVEGEAGPTCIVSFAGAAGCATGYSVIFEAQKDGSKITASSYNGTVNTPLLWQGVACKGQLAGGGSDEELVAYTGTDVKCGSSMSNEEQLTDYIHARGNISKFDGTAAQIGAKCAALLTKTITTAGTASGGS